MAGFFVYMLLCSDNSYYVGHTDNVEKRISEHKQGTYPCCYTQAWLPVKVVFVQQFSTRDDAFIVERQIKKWSRAKKKALSNLNWEEISALSQRRKTHLT